MEIAELQKYDVVYLCGWNGNLCECRKPFVLDENAVLQKWLERKRVSFVHEDELSSVFYGRDILNRILTAFDNVQDVYFMLKEVL